MKTLALNVKCMAILLVFASFFVFNSCSLESTELVQPKVNPNLQIESRSSGSQMAGAVKGKVAAHFNIQPTAVTSCYFQQVTSQGYYRYQYVLSGGASGGFMVTSIIGDDVDGFFF